MKPHLKSMLAMALAACMPVVAAETATITSSVNVRSGPDRSLPTVTWLLGGARVTVVGCVANWRWCDVIAGRDRGWVYSRYLSVPFQGSAVVIANGGPNARPAGDRIRAGALLGRALPAAAVLRTEGHVADALGPAAGSARVAGACASPIGADGPGASASWQPLANVLEPGAAPRLLDRSLHVVRGRLPAATRAAGCEGVTIESAATPAAPPTRPRRAIPTPLARSHDLT